MRDLPDVPAELSDAASPTRDPDRAPLREASAHLRGRATELVRDATGVRGAAALVSRQPRLPPMSSGADGLAPAKRPACPRCATPIDALDPVVALDGGDRVHVRCWRPPDPGHAAALPFAESPMPPLESFRSRPGRPAKRQPNGPAPGLR